MVKHRAPNERLEDNVVKLFGPTIYLYVNIISLLTV